MNNQNGLKNNLANCIFFKKPIISVEPCKYEPLLDLIGSVTIPETASNFVAKEKFVLGVGPSADIKFSYFGDNFISWFLRGEGKIEDQINEHSLRYHKLRKASVDGPIIEFLDGEEISETTLSEIFFLMVQQKNGEHGALLDNGYANIFYVKDIYCVLRSISLRRFGDGWLVSAFSINSPYRWSESFYVFSRNAVLRSLEFLDPV